MENTPSYWYALHSSADGYWTWKVMDGSSDLEITGSASDENSAREMALSTISQLNNQLGGADLTNIS